MNAAFLFPCAAVLLTGCSVWRSVSSGVSSASGAVVDGAKYVGSAMATGAGAAGRYAVNLMPWSGKDEKSQASPESVRKKGAIPSASGEKEKTAGTSEEPAAKPVPQFPPASRLLVTESALGPQPTAANGQTVALPGGWQITAPQISYRMESAVDYPAVFRASGGDCTATAGAGDTLVTASAKEIHYRKESGVLVLNGNPTVKAGTQTLRALGTGAMIKIEISSGAVGVDGQAQWSVD